METEKLGIENLKKAVLSLIGIAVAVDKALADKNIDRAEVIQIGLKSVGFASTLTFNWKSVKAEYKDLDATEKQELVDYAKSEFDLENDYVEQKIEKGLDIAVDIEEFFAVKKPAA